MNSCTTISHAIPILRIAIFSIAFIQACGALSQTIINIPLDNLGTQDNISGSIGSNTTLNVLDGGRVDPGFDAGLPNGTSVNVVVNVQGGFIGRDFQANSGSTINLMEGNVDSGFQANSGSQVNVFGGSFNILDANEGSAVRVVGAEAGFSNRLEANSGSQVVVEGGQVRIEAFAGSNVTIEGGASFLTARAGSSPVISGGVYGLGAGGISGLDGSTLNISGGSFSAFSTGLGVTRITGGTFDNGFTGRGTVEISGDAVIGNGVDATNSSTFDISGGTIGDDFDATVGGFGGGQRDIMISISGGSVGDRFRVGFLATADISGGTFGEDFQVGFGGRLNLLGTEFFLDGDPISGLSPGQQLIVNSRDSVLSGTLLDGSEFSFDLGSQVQSAGGGGLGGGQIDAFSEQATITVAIDTSSDIAGDYNESGFVDIDDFVLWQASFGSTANLQADGNQDQIVSAADYTIWRDNLGLGNSSTVASASAVATAVPEPSSLAVFLVSLAVGVFLRRENRFTSTH